MATRRLAHQAKGCKTRDKEIKLPPSTIGGINLLPDPEKRAIYARYIPAALLEKYNVPPLTSAAGYNLLQFRFAPGSTDVEMRLFHKMDFPDPLLYAHLTDTLNGQIHILLYILNDPDSPRFDVDKTPDGLPTKFGTLRRNIEAEQSALEAGLAPGQVRRGLRMLGEAVGAFEKFVTALGQEMYFVEPLYYHVAVVFERYGFNYQMGKRLMNSIHAGFQPGGDLLSQLDGSNPFRQPEAANSIRKRSWAIHDGILGEPFTNVTMYKQVGKSAGITTAPDCTW
jgi:acetoin utilization protein AcuC